MAEDRRTNTPLAKDPQGLNSDIYRFWAQEKLCFQRCTDCGTWRHLPRFMCAHCGSGAWEWAESSGRGRIFSWTITHQPMHPAFAGDIPYASIVVEMDEGVRLVSRIHDLPLDQLRFDLPVEVVFRRVSNEMALPYFRPRNVS